MELLNKICVVTGAGSGLGFEIVKRFLEEKARVVAVDYSEEGKEALSRLSSDVRFCKADVSKEADTKKMIDFAVTAFGRIDVVVANAGISGTSTLLTQNFDDWKRVLSVNLDGVYLTNHYASLQMIEQGTGGVIINTSSIGGLVGFGDGYSYSASKAAVVNMTRASVVGLADKGVRVNAVAPGFFNSPLFARLPIEVKKDMVKKIPMGRVAEVEEVANAYVFLASDRARYITGVTLPVDGGFIAI